MLIKTVPFAEATLMYLNVFGPYKYRSPERVRFTVSKEGIVSSLQTLDKTLKPSRVSQILRMTNERIEYWSGLCFSIEKDSYWVSYGVKDSEAWLAEFKKESVETFLNYSME